MPFLESLQEFLNSRKGGGMPAMARLFFGNVIFTVALVAVFLPTLVTKQIIYGSYAKSGYENLWVWTSPWVLNASFSADHGLFSWTPILIAGVVGLFFLARYDREVAIYLILVFAAVLYTIGCYKNWDGLSSFGNRYFIALTPIYVLGLAAFFDGLERAWNERGALIASAAATTVLILWNLGLIFQWGTHMIPVRGPISWRDAAYNQFALVPTEASQTVKNYLTHRKGLMDQIEQEDVDQLKTKREQGTQ
jgi:hypothetical protein